VDVPSFEEVLLNLTDTDGGPFTVRLKNVLYVPGLTQRLFSVIQFAQNNNTADIVNNLIYLTFIDRTIMCPIFSATMVTFNMAIAPKKQLQAPGTKLETSGLSHWKAFTTDLVIDAEIPSCLP
jgi:hypothetical protein